ncbi:MAG: FHA domain-containing protein [Lentisphaeria bacterium]
MSKLVCIAGMNKGDEFPLHEGMNTIGRANDNTVVLFDKKCSRLHAQVIKKGTYYTVEDQGSRNSTAVNGKIITQKTSLREGDHLHVGKTILVLSEKSLGGIIEQTIVDAAADLQNQNYDALVGAAASKVAHGHPAVRISTSSGISRFFHRLFHRRSPL